MRGDEFEDFVRTHRSSLLRFAVSLTGGDAHLAEDLVQSALIRVYFARTRRKKDLAYVRRAMVNAAIDYHRRPFSRRERAMSAVPEHASMDWSDSVDPDLTAALATLPTRMRAAVFLRHVDGFSVHETAAILGCSEGTVKSQTARGLDKLRVVVTTLTISNPLPSRVDVRAPSAVGPKAARVSSQHLNDSRQGERPCPT